MDSSSLTRAVSDFSKSLSSLNHLLVAMTAIVVAGLIIEYFPEIPHEWRKFIRIGGWKALRTKRAAWRPLAIFLGTALVTGGVAGELLFEWLSFQKEGQLEDANTKLNTFLQGKAQSAEDSAKGAAGAATNAIGASAIAMGLGQEASKEAESFEGKIASTSRQAGSAKSIADGAKKEVDGAKRDADSVRAEVRAATQELQVVEDFVSARHVIDLKPFDNLKNLKRKIVVLIALEGDPEAIGFCQDLVDKLSPALGWVDTTTAHKTKFPLSSCGGMEGPQSGVGVLVSGSDTVFTHALEAVINFIPAN
jgi:hypothetical protein